MDSKIRRPKEGQQEQEFKIRSKENVDRYIQMVVSFVTCTLILLASILVNLGIKTLASDTIPAEFIFIYGFGVVVLLKVILFDFLPRVKSFFIAPAFIFFTAGIIDNVQLSGKLGMYALMAATFIEVGFIMWNSIKLYKDMRRAKVKV